VSESTPDDDSREEAEREGAGREPAGRDVVDREALAGAAFSAVRWTGLARMAGEFVAFAATVALARLLTPADFGVAAVAMVATTIALQTGQQGLTAPLVQRRTIDDAHLRVAVLLSLVLGLALAAVVALLGEPLLQPVFGDDIAELIPLTAPFFVLAGLTAVPQARLERALGFRQLGLIYVARMITGSLASVALALAGVDAAALVLGPLAGVAIATVLLLIISPTVRPAWHRAEAREIMRFGFPSLGSGLASIGAQHIDYAVVAARLPAASVGLYWRAYTLGVDYQGKLSGILVQIGLPLYARAADLATRQAMRERIVRFQTLLLFPLLGALILLAPVAVPLIFGDQWEEAVEPTQILAVAGMMAAIQAGTGPLLLAVGRPGVLLRWNLSKIIGLGLVVYFVAPEGLVALAAAVTIFNVARSLIGQQILLSRYAGIDVRGLFVVCFPALTATAALLLLGWGVLAGLRALGAPDGVCCTAGAAVGVLAYIATLALAFPAALAELRDVRNRLLPRGPRLRRSKTGGYTEARPGA
jgi:PST family polysaccharide transporter